MAYRLPGESPDETIERLLARIGELEDFQQRVEADAAEAIRLSEELEIARERAEKALLKEQELKATIEKMALFDPLTGLANRNQFHRRFDEALQFAARDDKSVALLMFDLDKFKQVNDTFGHPTGDELLRLVSDVLRESTRETDTVARFGGDEFAIILTRLDKDERATLVAERVIDCLSKPITIDGALIETGTSIGISLFPRDGKDFEDLMRTADLALYRAKKDGRGQYRYYDGEMDTQVREAHILESDLRLAVVRDEFCLHYQPQLMTGREHVICVEALVRWHHPSRGLLYPIDFIEAAENSGLLVHIGKLVLQKACEQCRTWLDSGMEDFRISVNVSATQFRDDAFVSSVVDVVETTGIAPRNLEIEITETVMMENLDDVMLKMNALRDLGVHISVDDFGTGYSSLAYLRRLPINRLKIDKSFVENLAKSENDMAIAEAIVRMGQSLGLEVVAEGIESAVQAQSLMEKGCDQFQGYHISRPLPPEELTVWMQNRPSSGL